MTRFIWTLAILVGFCGNCLAESEWRRVQFETTEGTWISVDISPNGQRIVFDLLGDIYSLSANGGQAQALAIGREWQHQPKYSPDGQSIAFISDKDGQLNLWVMKADGTSPRQLSQERLNRISSPSWCGNDHVIARRQNGTHEELWMYHVNGGSGLRVPGSASYPKASGPICSPDGQRAFFAAPVDGEYSFYYEDFVPSQQIIQLDLLTGESIPITAGISGGLRPQISRDGRKLAFAKRQSGITSLWVRDLRTGHDVEVIPRVLGSGLNATTHADLLPGYSFSPDGDSIVIHLDGQISRVDLSTKDVSRIPFKAKVQQELAPLLSFRRQLNNDDIKVRIVRWPTLSTDRSRLYFSALGKIWVVEQARGKPRRLTNSQVAEYAPALSPDGESLVYSTWSDADGGGHLVLSDADGSRPRQLSQAVGQYLNPTWSSDGSKVFYVRGSGGIEQLQQEPAVKYRSEIRWVNVETGEEAVVGVVRRPRSSERGHPVPMFVSESNRVFYISEHDEPGRRALVSRKLDGSQEKVHLRFPAVDEGAVSPDGAKVALVRGNKIFVLPFSAQWAGTIDIDLDNYLGSSLPIIRIDTDRADFLTWQDPTTLLWAAGPNIFEANLTPEELSDNYSTKSSSFPVKLVHEIDLKLPRARPDGLFAIRNVQLITMRGDEVIANGTIVVDGGRIADIGPADSTLIPREAKIFDGENLTIMPGLVDTHAHMHMTDWGTYPQQIWQHVANLAYGVTTTFDPATHSVEIFELRDMVDVGWMLGPRIFSSGTILGGYNPQNNPWYQEVTSFEDAQELISSHALHDVDMLKEYMHPRRDQRQLIVRAAQERQIPVTGEQGGDFTRILTMLLDGYTAVEHSLPIAPIYDDVAQLFVESGTFHTPTFSIPNGGRGLLNYYSPKLGPVGESKLKRFLPYERFADYLSWRHVPDEEWFFKAQARAANKISNAGGMVSMGSHNQYHGIAVHWELWARSEGGGSSPHEILRDATLRGAQKIGVDTDLGSLEKGKFADFLVLSANPLEEIRNTAEIQLVIKDGFMYDAESMSRIWPDHKKLEPFFWQQYSEAMSDMYSRETAEPSQNKLLKPADLN